MKEDLSESLATAKNNNKENKSITKKLKRTKPKSLDETVHQMHDDEFENIDCLTCANCCKTTSPAIYDRDIDRLAKHLKLKPSLFITNYLRVDEDGDYVFKSAPCPFLGGDNYCSVYSARPLACKEYPHTNRKRFYQILDVSLNNTLICPVVANIFEKLKVEYT